MCIYTWVCSSRWILMTTSGLFFRSLLLVGVMGQSLHCQHVPLHEKCGYVQILPSPLHGKVQNLQLSLTETFFVIYNVWLVPILCAIRVFVPCTVYVHV